MTESTDAIKHLEMIRERLVEERRNRAEYGTTADYEDAADHIIAIQRRISAVDEAIADERKLNSSPAAIIGRQRHS